MLGRESGYRLQLEDWLGTIDVAASRVLDIGGGLNPARGRTKSWSVGEYRILDNNGEGDFHPDFLLDLNTAAANRVTADRVRRFAPEVVFCLEVMEYVFDPVSALKFIGEIHSPRGTAYLSFPSVYPPHEPLDCDYLRYTRQGVVRLLAEAGFVRHEITPRKAVEGKQALAEFYRGEKMKPARTEAVFDIGYLVAAHKQ